ncbi:hypothetical protein BH09PSE1_BH09PSE1_23320 [soil metagenome]
MRVSGATGAGLMVAGLLLAGCAGVTPAAEPTVVASSAPAPVAGYDWFFNEDDHTREVSLSYGVAESDEVLLGMHCVRGDGAQTLVRSVPHGWPARILLESGGDTETYAAEAEDDPVQDGQFLTAAAKTSDPVFKRFRRVGWLAVLDDQNRTLMVPHPGSAARVEEYFAACS